MDLTAPHFARSAADRDIGNSKCPYIWENYAGVCAIHGVNSGISGDSGAIWRELTPRRQRRRKTRQPALLPCLATRYATGGHRTPQERLYALSAPRTGRLDMASQRPVRPLTRCSRDNQ